MLIFVLLLIYSLVTGSSYVNDFFFLAGFLWLVYWFKDKLNLHPFHFFLFASFLVMHNLGVFGNYNYFYFGIEYDMYVHFLFGLSASLILFRAYRLNKREVSWYSIFLIIGLILGASVFHELFEFFGALFFGEGEGVLLAGAGDIDKWDTQKDFMFNLIGAVVGIGAYWIKKKIFIKKF